MKQFSATLSILFMLVVLSCESSTVTGSEDVIVIQNVSISLDSTYVFGNEFRANGTITNNSNSNIIPIWYLEGSFFRDANSSFKMGGENTSFTFSLAPDQTTGWELRFNDSQYPASNYPDFSVGELRAYRYESD
ncbi:MAG: hypothetical protein ED557_02195 [Balneola sp.]|nr:MAG: hypothetical protein ED557_02195 [Balneola sp.]